MKLKRKFFERPAAKVAQDLIGKYIVHKIGKKKIVLMITETEAYLGEEDLASHARFGRTKRSEIMYGHAGIWYVYLIYGMHEMLNVVVQPHGLPGAVLIRAGIVESLFGQKISKKNNINGPGKVTKYLKVSRIFNAKSALSGGLYFEDRGVRVNPKQIKKTPRIGVDYAGAWKNKKLRFVLVE